jgi:NADPH:quinone reductase
MGSVAVLEREHERGKLVIRDIPPITPEEGEIVVQNIAIGLSALDSMTRLQLANGIFQSNKIVVGYEGVGNIVSVGAGVKGFSVGQKVVYLSPTAGACATHCSVKAKFAVSIPVQVQDKVLTATFLRSILGHALSSRVFIVAPPVIVLIHDVWTSTGQTIARVVKSRKPKMLIGTVTKDEEIPLAKELGICDHVFNHNSETMVEEILKVTDRSGVHVVYDGVGSPYIMKKSLNALATFGLLVLYNSSIFKIPHVPILDMAKRSLFVTAPSVFDYINVREEFVLRANEVFTLISTGVLAPRYVEYPMAQLQDALDYSASPKAPDSVIIKF